MPFKGQSIIINFLRLLEKIGLQDEALFSVLEEYYYRIGVDETYKWKDIKEWE